MNENITAALESGKSADDLIREYSRLVKQEEKKINNARAAQSNAAKEKVIAAEIEWYKSMGVPMGKKEEEELKKVVDEIEIAIRKMVTKDRDMDIIERFLKTL
jgi:Skp family chaperone for outer membrane proteins